MSNYMHKIKAQIGCVFTVCLFITIALYGERTWAQNTPSQISDEQAHEIVLTGTPDDVKKLIQSGYDVNKVYLCNTLLISAIKSAALGLQQQMLPTVALEKVNILVNNGANVNFVPCAENNLGMEPLNWAVSLPVWFQYMGDMSVAAFNQRINMGVGECNLPPIIAKSCKDVTEAERIQINNAIQASFAEMAKQMNPYFIEIADYLIKHGANINGNQKNRKAIMPIHLAARYPMILLYLIKNGADINIQDSDGNTALFWANGEKESIEMLIKAGAKTDIRNKNGSLYYQVDSIPILGLSTNL